MPSELRPKITVYAGGTALRHKSISFTREISDPASCVIVLDNSQGDYGIASALAFPQTYAGILSFTVETGEAAWTSPDLILDEYHYNTAEVTLQCSCKLSLLELEDQFLADAVDTDTATVIAAILAAYGMTGTGAPARSFAGPYHMAGGRPIDWIKDLCYPTHEFYMGADSVLVMAAVATNPSTAVLVDKDHLQDVKISRTKRVYNKAIVERIVPESGRITLFEEARSGGETLGLQGPFPFTQPTRNLIFTKRFGERGFLNSIVLLESDLVTPINTLPLYQNAYSSTTEIHGFKFSYDLDPDADTWGAWLPNWAVTIEGYPLDSNPIPTEGYSATGTAGAGNRPYPEPFSSLLLENQTAAQTAADALATVGNRQGCIGNFVYRLLANKIPAPNDSVTVTDYKSGLSSIPFVVESISITADEEGDPGEIRLEGSRSE